MEKGSLYKSHGVLWRTYKNDRDREWIIETPLCPNDACHTVLQQLKGGFYCISCDRTYPCNKPYSDIIQSVRLKWEGHRTLDYKIYSLDLPPTSVKDNDNEDERYWVQAKIGEKNGKRMAVVYFGERVSGAQEKTDYSQIFLDFEDEQLRFDKTNKNPMKLLSKLTAEFPESEVVVKKTK